MVQCGAVSKVVDGANRVEQHAWSEPRGTTRVERYARRVETTPGRIIILLAFFIHPFIHPVIIVQIK